MMVLFCCNDGGTGIFTGRFDFCEVGHMRFEALNGGVKLAYDFKNKSIKIAGKRFAVTGYKYGYGNWCWDAVNMRDDRVLELLNWPSFRKWFAIDEADQRLEYFYKAGEQFSMYQTRLIEKGYY